MSFTPNIPATGQSLGFTRDLIKNNFTNYNNVISVDHFEPNDGNQGQHLQLTIPDNNIPTVNPGSMLYTASYLFTNTSQRTPAPGVNLNQLFFYPLGANAARADNQYAYTATSGSTYLFGGIILKWGTTTTTGIQTFSSPFVNSCFGVTLTPAGSSVVFTANTFTTTGFTMLGLNGVSVFYIALGN